MSSGLISGLSSGLGQSLGTTAAGSAAGTAAAEAAGTTAAGTIGSAVGSGIGGAMDSGVAGPLARMMTNSGSPKPAEGTAMSDLAASKGATDPSGNKGGWLGLGLFGNDKYNPNPSTYAPQTGSGAAQAAMPKPRPTTPIALQLLNQLPVTDPRTWNV